MTPRRRLASLLIAYHLIAVSLAAIPSPGELDAVGPAGVEEPRDRVARALTPVFDRSTVLLARVERFLYVVTQPFRSITQPYVSAGIRQRWRMFAHPPTDNRYVRLRYYVQPFPGAPVANVYSELVLPVGRRESLRYFRGKAIRNALDAYLAKEFREVVSPAIEDTAGSGLYRDLIPLVRYYRGRFQRAQAATVHRTELWYGSAPVPPPGQRIDAGVLSQRREALDAYEQVRAQNASTVLFPSRGTVEREADIRWTLEFIE